MKLEIYKSLWGMTGTLEAQLEAIAKAGYTGIESGLGTGGIPAGELRKLLDRHHLKLILMVFSAGADAAAHAASFEADLAKAAEYEPVKITAHSARDFFTFDEQCRFYDAAVKSEGKHGIAVGHETHRGRAMFTPWNTHALLKKFPALKICADFSHWCCVAESLLNEGEYDLNTAISRTIHIHGRVGHEEGPQVADPAAPEYQRHLERHESWWQRMFTAQKSSAFATATFTPEFGPPGYMQTLPYTQQPVADLWNVCLWMASRARKNFGEQFA